LDAAADLDAGAAAFDFNKPRTVGRAGIAAAGIALQRQHLLLARSKIQLLSAKLFRRRERDGQRDSHDREQDVSHRAFYRGKADFAIAVSSEVGTGSREENASKQKA
jgi:hypothetical protein